MHSLLHFYLDNNMKRFTHILEKPWTYMILDYFSTVLHVTALMLFILSKWSFFFVYLSMCRF